MNRKRKYEEEDGPSENARIVPNFLPSPEEILASFERQKVTLILDYDSVAFFKKHAKKAKKPYQRMMREVLRQYVQRHRAA